MTLIRSSKIAGYATLVEHDPRIETHQDVLYVPLQMANAAAGIYDFGRRLVPTAAFFRGVPKMCLLNAELFSTINPDDVTSVYEEELIFGGMMAIHYGHYLVTTLSRYWWVQYSMNPKAKILLLNPQPPELFFKFPFVRDTMAQLGLDSSNFISFDKPMRLRRLIVPAPSFEENNFAHRAFSRLCNRIGWSMTNNLSGAIKQKPVYLTKEKVKSGVTTIVNENEVSAYLEKRGVDIVCPEELALVDQIRLFRDYPVVTGQSSSALHTGVFTPQNRLIALNHGPDIASNQILIDKTNNNETLYLYPQDGLTREAGNGKFGNTFRFVDPARTASEFLRAIDAFMAAKNLRDRQWDPPATGPSNIPVLYPPRGTNLSRGKPATQSSVSLISGCRPTVAEDAAGAVSGLLTGYYQFHTEVEDQPWWEVDLQSACTVEEVRLYNRLDHVASRSAKFRILVSTDRHAWTEVFRREDPSPFGGLDGRPFRWLPLNPLTARFVRLQLLIREFFHLDQVEIYGQPA